MNIQIPRNHMPFGPASPSTFSPHLQMIQMLITTMIRLMTQMQGQGMLGQRSPGFGSCEPFSAPGANENSSYSTGGHASLPGFGGFSGNGNSSSSSTPGGYSTDSYVPPGAGQSGQVGNLGSGSGADAVRWALGREGISESNNPAAVREISRGRWQPWCADFVSQAYANSPGGSPFGHQSSVAGILAWGRENDRFFEAGQAQGNPSMLRPGDVAVWKSGGRSHVGLVTGVNPDGTFNTIEGNTGDAVRRRTHSFGRGLTGFVRPRG